MKKVYTLGIITILLLTVKITIPLDTHFSSSYCGSISDRDLRYYCYGQCGSISDRNLRYLCYSGKKYPEKKLNNFQ